MFSLHTQQLRKPCQPTTPDPGPVADADGESPPTPQAQALHSPTRLKPYTKSRESQNLCRHAIALVAPTCSHAKTASATNRNRHLAHDANMKSRTTPHSRRPPPRTLSRNQPPNQHPTSKLHTQGTGDATHSLPAPRDLKLLRTCTVAASVRLALPKLPPPPVYSQQPTNSDRGRPSTTALANLHRRHNEARHHTMLQTSTTQACGIDHSGCGPEDADLQKNAEPLPRIAWLEN